jgi:hypothetical protein
MEDQPAGAVRQCPDRVGKVCGCQGVGGSAEVAASEARPGLSGTSASSFKAHHAGRSQPPNVGRPLTL